MAFQGLLVILLCAVLASAQESFFQQQQLALDKIAEQIRNDWYPSCTAPQLTSCGTDECSGSGCRYFKINFASTKEVTSLFAF